MRLKELLESVVHCEIHGDEDAVVEEAVSQLKQEMAYGDSCVNAEWRMHNGGDPYDDEIECEGEDYDRFVEDWCYEQVGEAFENVTMNFHGDKIRIWRMITAPLNWSPEGRHPGIYWSWDERAAEAHWGNVNDSAHWLISGETTADQVNWVQTLFQNAHSSFEDEKEIRLKPQANVKILKYEIVN